MPPKAHAFTNKFNKGITRVLQSEVRISAAYDPAKTPSPPLPRRYVGVWDTGATGTVISSKVVQECGLKPIRMTEVHGVHGKSLSNVYLVNVGLPNKVEFVGLSVTEGKLAGGDVLIGMDIITRGDFAITHCDGHTCFSFRVPSIETIDFVSRGEKSRPLGSAEVPRPVGRNAPCPCGSGKKYKRCCGK